MSSWQSDSAGGLPRADRRSGLILGDLRTKINQLLDGREAMRDPSGPVGVVQQQLEFRHEVEPLSMQREDDEGYPGQ